MEPPADQVVTARNRKCERDRNSGCGSSRRAEVKQAAVAVVARDDEIIFLQERIQMVATMQIYIYRRLMTMAEQGAPRLKSRLWRPDPSQAA